MTWCVRMCFYNDVQCLLELFGSVDCGVQRIFLGGNRMTGSMVGLALFEFDG